MIQATRQSVAYKDHESAYRLSQPARQLREVRTPRRQSISPKHVAVFLVVSALALLIVYNYMTLTQLTETASQKATELNDLNSEYTYLKSQQENMLSLSYVEEYAEDNLNMIKMDASQVEYIELSNPDQIEVSGTSSEIREKASGFTEAINKLLDFIK
jgi:cell division protein FtsL